MKIYISFGQIHVHNVNGKTFDKNCLAEIDCDNWEHGRKIAFDTFGEDFGTDYPAKGITEIASEYFPRGIINIKSK